MNAIDAAGLAVGCERHAAQTLRVLAFEVTVAEARERQRIAQMLHDDLGQLLAMVQFKLSELTQELIGIGLADPFEELRLLVREAAKAARVATYELHSSVLDQQGMDAAVNSLAERLRRTSAICVHVDGGLGKLALPEMVMAVMFRTVRELAQNAQRHANASNLWIAMRRRGSGLSISITDDGIGFDVADDSRKFSREGGFGLFSAETQMQAIGGRLLMTSSPGNGTTATVEFGPNANGAPLRSTDPRLRLLVSPVRASE